MFYFQSLQHFRLMLSAKYLSSHYSVRVKCSSASTQFPLYWCVTLCFYSKQHFVSQLCNYMLGRKHVNDM